MSLSIISRLGGEFTDGGVLKNNTVNNSEQSAGGANISMGIVKSDTEDSINDSRVNNFNPIDKITELYERLLKEKDEKYAALETPFAEY